MRKVPGRIACAALLLAVLAALLAQSMTFAAPVPGQGRWDAGFETTTGRLVKPLTGVKVGGGELKLAEERAQSLGPAVPGETSVNCMVAIGDDVLTGTGPAGHLVHYDADQLWQEGYRGPSHYGVSNSRGQAVLSNTDVTALATDGAKVFGGTSSGRLFDMASLEVGVRPHDRATAGGPVSAMTYAGGLVYGGTANGSVFSYDPIGRSVTDLGQPDGGSPVNASVSIGGVPYFGLENGGVFKREGAGFVRLGELPGPVSAMAADGAILYAGSEAGSEAGDVYGCDTAAPAFVKVGDTLAGAVGSLAVRAGTLFAGLSDGHVHSYGGGPWVDEGSPAGSGGKPVNALAVAAGTVYGGTGDGSEGSEGRLFRLGGPPERHEGPLTAPISSIAFSAKALFFTQGADLFTMSSPGAYDDLAGATTAINDMESTSGIVYAALENGRLGTWKEGQTSFDEPDNGNATPALSVLVVGQKQYLGLEDGRLLDGSGVTLATAPSPIVDLVNKSGAGGAPEGIYAASGSSLLALRDGTFETAAACDSAVNALAVHGGVVYAGCQSGSVYRYDGTAAAMPDAAESAILSMCPGASGVALGTAGGKLYLYDSALRDQGELDPVAGVRALCRIGASVWAGTGEGNLFARDDAHLGDLGQQVKPEIMVWCLAYDEARGVFYAGTYQHAHFLVVDAEDLTVKDLGRPIPGEREIEDILVTESGLVVGSTYGGTEEHHNPAGGHVFSYEPDAADAANGDFTDRGRAPADNNWWVSSLVEQDGLIYAATSNSAVDAAHSEGRMFGIEPVGATWSLTDMGVPVPGEGTRSLAVSGGYIYGATWQPNDDEVSSVYRCDPAGPAYTHLGDAPPEGTSPNKHVNRLRSLKGRIYCAQNNGGVFSFDPLADSWDPTVPVKPVEQGDFIYPLHPLGVGEESTLLCGTGSVGGSPGHLVDYDPDLGEFREIDILEVTGHDEVSAIAGTTGAASPFTLCGTRGSRKSPAGDRHPGTIFRIMPYRSEVEASALSTSVDTRLRELELSPGALPSQPDEVAAACEAPGGARRMYVGVNTADDGGKLLSWDVMTQTAQALVPVPGRIEVLAPGPDGCLYVGTGVREAKGGLYKFDPVHPGELTALDIGLNGERWEWVLALATGPDGKMYVGTGAMSGYATGRLLRFDPSDPGHPEVLIDGLGAGHLYRVRSLIAKSGKIYGVSGGVTAQFFTCDPAGGPDTPRTLPAFASETSANEIVAATGGKLYIGTGPSGKIVCYDIAGGASSEVHDFGGKEVTAMAFSSASGAEVLYGCAGPSGHLFRYSPEGGPVELDPISVDNKGVPAAACDRLGNVYFCATGASGGLGRLFRFDPNAAAEWGTVSYERTRPGNTRADIYTTNESGDDPREVPESGGAVGRPGESALRIRAVLSTDDSSVSPSTGEWTVTWWTLPSIDAVQCPHAEGVYRGETVSIWGSDFGAGEGTVTVGGLQADVAEGNWREGFITARVPDGAPGGTVKVRRDNGKEGPAVEITLLEPPRLESIQPAAAMRGQLVELRGSGFLATRAGEDVVSFNGIPATAYELWSDTLIRVRVPDGASTGNVDVSVNGHVSNSLAFTVKSPTGPTVDITRPADGATVKGTVRIAADVERDGSGGPVELFVDGARAGADSSVPYEFDWNADSVPDGAHSIEVRARDAHGRTGSDAITLYVDHTVPSAAATWYFAEGCTDFGFETWVLIQNPGKEPANTTVSFMDEEGAKHDFACVVQPWSRTTVNAADVAPGASVSVKIEADRKVVCERAMYWADRAEGHATTGTTRLSRTWYFAEGSTDWGFETFVLIGNPGATGTRAVLRYLFSDGTAAEFAHQVDAHSRLTVNPASEVGARDFSLSVDSDAPVVAERAMYHGSRRCGTATIGCQEPSTTWYLSEGSTDWGFETWLLVQRPGAGDAKVTVTYRKANGLSEEREYVVKGNSRRTLNLAEEVGVADVSTQVTSNLPLVCERSMYWGGRTAGHCTIGSPAPGTTWNLAEGCTDYGFETWVLVDNPGRTTARPLITFMTEDGRVVGAPIEVGAGSRVSIDASAHVGRASFSTRVECATPIMVERSMYWNRRSGGTGSIGAR